MNQNQNEKELREIEARIAVELFGFVWVETGLSAERHASLRNGQWVAERRHNAWLRELPETPALADRFDDWDFETPRYARDIAAAMVAAEKIAAMWTERNLPRWWRFDRLSDNESWAYIETVGVWGAVTWQSATASTLPEAIARCIVAALDAEGN